MAGIRVTECPLQGLYLIRPELHTDSRGWFMETYNRRDLAAAGLDREFVQDNQSASVRGTLRGLHFQKSHPQGKLIRVVEGRIFDVAVDLRPDSRTYGKWYGVELSRENREQLYIPEGFAHGFLVLSSRAEVCYKTTDYYHPGDEGGIAWNDPALGIRWPEVIPEEQTLTDGTPLVISEKDRNWPGLR